MDDTKRDTEAEESFIRAIAGEVFAFATVFGSAWRVLRHPFAFKDHLIYKPKQTVHFFFVSAGLATFFAGTLFTTPGAEHTGFKLEAVAVLHRLLPGLRAELQGEDIIPFGLLILAVIAGFLVHGVWRSGRWLLSDRAKAWLRKGPGVTGARLSLAIGAFVYSVGVVVLAYALFVSLALVYPQSPDPRGMAAFRYLVYGLDGLLCYAMLIFMIGTPVWIARIYGVRLWALPAAGYVTLVVIAMVGLPLSPTYRDSPDYGHDRALISEHATLPFYRASAKPASDAPPADAQPDVVSQADLPSHYRDMLGRIVDAARKGNAAAETTLGWLCQTGWGVDCDKRQTASWYRAAADQGDADAANTLGVLLLDRIAPGGDYTEILSLFRKAAEQGMASAQSNLGWLYQHGWGVPQSFDNAMTWYRKAAERGNAAAADYIGLLDQNANGAKANPAEALGWFRKAAERGNADAENNLGLADLRGVGAAESGADAATWFLKAARQGYGPAEANLGWMYQHGVGVARHDAEGRAWQQRAAAQGVTRAVASELSLFDFDAHVGDRIFFAPGSAVIQPHAAVILMRQADWLKQNPDASVTIAGHADGQETASPEAAQRLGAQRALAAKGFLVAEGGIDGGRLQSVSYGAARPAVPGSDETAQAQNRVAVTTIK